MTQSIHTEISDAVLQFDPESGPLSFAIAIANTSSQFASFQVALVAPGVDPAQQSWYRLSPAVSSKIPPGDQTRFQAHLLTVPPVPGGFTGQMNLTIRVYSPELRQEDRKDLRLIITGDGLLLPKVTLLRANFKARPQEAVEIAATVYNPNRKSLEVLLELEGMPTDWLPEGTQKSLSLVPSEEQRITFVCQLPAPTHAPSRLYPLSLQTLQPASATPPQQILLEVLPSGFVEFQCDPYEQWIPAKARRWLNPLNGTNAYTLAFVNRSNLTVTGAVSVVDEDEVRQQRRRLRRRRGDRDDDTPEPETEEQATAALPAGMSLIPPDPVVVPGATTELQLAVTQRLPWWGWSRLRRLQVQADLKDTELDLRNETQTLELHVLPVIPFWLQVAGGLIGVCLLGGLWWWWAQRGHTQPVYAVQFNGTGTEIVSGSSDQTLRRWQVRGKRLSPKGVIERGDKAVRVVRYRPVNNDWVAAGLENGTIQLRSLLSGQERAFESASDDRVFDLTFDQDARALWSAHGSGLVLKWGLTPDLGLVSRETPQQSVEADFAVSAIALAGNADTLLAIGGRYQEFVLVDLEAEDAIPLPYRSGEQTDYINSLETAEAVPNLIAAADSQGYVSLWDMGTCWETGGQCEPIDEWVAHGGNAVRSVAFSQDGCFLASAGDDGQVRLWSLTAAGERQPEAIEGEVLRRSGLPLNAVDVRQQEQWLVIASGGDDRKVRLNRVRQRADDTCRTNR